MKYQRILNINFKKEVSNYAFNRGSSNRKKVKRERRSK